MLTLDKLINKFDLMLVNDVDAKKIEIKKSNLNRLAIQLTGYIEYFDFDRIQFIGKIEYEFINKMDSKEKEEIFTKLFSKGIPAIIFCRKIQPQKEVIEIANKFNVALLTTELGTSKVYTELMRYLKYELAVMTTRHGVLVDIYGEGVFIIGDSGIGKSETALELIKRGHRMVADDAVEIKKTSNVTLEGTSPEIIRYFMELIGIGIIDVRKMFGVESVKETQQIDLVINLVHWDKTVEYDRLGLDEKTYDILGVKVPCNTIPVKPGRNLAMICEVAAISRRNRKMGYNSAEVLNKRITDRINNN